MPAFPDNAKLLALRVEETDYSPTSYQCQAAHIEIHCSSTSALSPWNGLVSDNSWKVKNSEESDWQTIDFDDSNWSNAATHQNNDNAMCGITYTGFSVWYMRKTVGKSARLLLYILPPSRYLPDFYQIF